MRTLFIATAAVFLAASAFASDATSDPKDVNGVWLVRGGTVIVQIKDCGDGTPCGKIAHIFARNPQQILDTQNPDSELSTQPLIGSKMLWGFKEKSDKWSGGKIYDAESGKSYTSKLELKSDGTLEVKGCVGPICQKQIWTEIKLD